MPLNSTYRITRPKHNAYDKKCLVLKWQHRNYVVFRNNLVVRMKMFPERIFVRLRYKFETTARCHREVWFKSCTRCYVHSIFSIFYILGMLAWTVFTLTTENIYSIYWTKFKAIPSPLVLFKLWFFDLLIRLAVWIISHSQKLMGILYLSDWKPRDWSGIFILIKIKQPKIDLPTMRKTKTSLVIKSFRYQYMCSIHVDFRTLRTNGLQAALEMNWSEANCSEKNW